MAENESQNFRLELPEGAIEYTRKSPLLKRLEKEIEAWSFLSEINIQDYDFRLARLDIYVPIRSGVKQLEALRKNIELSSDFASLSAKVTDSTGPYSGLLPWLDTEEGVAAQRAKQNGHIEICLKILYGVILKRHNNAAQFRKWNSDAPGIISETIATANTAKMYNSFVVKDAVRMKISSLAIDVANEVEEVGKLVDSANRRIEAISSSTEEITRNLNRKADRKAKLFKRLINSGLAEGDKLRDKFLVQMRYRAPVKLWEERQQHHEANAKSAIIQFYIGSFLIRR